MTVPCHKWVFNLTVKWRSNDLGSHVGCPQQALRPACLVGMPGFEPGASCSQSRRATKLRHIPMNQP